MATSQQLFDYQHSSEYLCSSEERNSYRFGTTTPLRPIHTKNDDYNNNYNYISSERMLRLCCLPFLVTQNLLYSATSVVRSRTNDSIVPVFLMNNYMVNQSDESFTQCTI